jgi:hypothetical protein
MSTAVIYNGFGQYEQNEHGQKGITLGYGGMSFWLPFDKVTYIPDFTLREVDHAESTPPAGQEGSLIYKSARVDGRRIAEELLEIQVPYANSKKGIILIENTKEKRKNSYVEAFAGYTEEGAVIKTEVQEVEPTQAEIDDAHARARAYKEEMVGNYFQAKRERMAGGQGPIVPLGLIRVYMRELGIKDIDDVARQLETAVATPGVTMEQLLLVVREIIGSRDTSAGAPVAPAPPTAPVVKDASTKAAEDLV